MSEDYVSTIKIKPNGSKSSNFLDKSWWECSEDTAWRSAIETAKAIDTNQKNQRYKDLRHGYLYQNRVTYDFGLPFNRSWYDNTAVTYNVVKSATDTLTSKITQQKPRPRILTHKGNYDQQNRAEKLTQYIDGIFASCDTYREGRNAFRDGCVFGTGVIKVGCDTKTGDIFTERVLPSELLVDELEGAYGKPQTIFQVKLVAKEILNYMFPDKKTEIEKARLDDQQRYKHVPVVDMVKVYESWHLPDSEGKGGKHIIAIENSSLLYEDWEYDCFPFAFFRYTSNLASFFGQGVAEELTGMQLEINRLLRDIQKAQHLIASPRILVDSGSKVNTAHLNNKIGAIVKYTGSKPDFINPIAMNNEIYNHVKWLISSSFEQVGVSEMSVASKKPAGLESGRALREFSNIESERFATTVQGYEEFYQDIATLVVKFSQALYKDGVDKTITAESKKFIESIKWSEVCLDEKEFVVRMTSSSLLPLQPAARVQKVQEYIQAGWMSREQGLALLDHPDTEAWETLETADLSLTYKIVSDILGKGIYSPPEPEMLLDQDIEIARKAYLEAKENGVDEDKREMLLRWIEAAASLMPAPTTPQPQPGLAGVPQGQAAPLPQADLIPQVSPIPGV